MSKRNTILGVSVRPAPLPPALVPTMPQGATLEAILESISLASGVSQWDIAGPSHKPEFVRARRQFVRAARTSGFTLKQIGAKLHRHHTSILHLSR